MDESIRKQRQNSRRSIPSSLGQLCEINEMAKTADGRTELRRTSVLRDEQHYRYFRRTPEEVIERSRTTAMTPERRDIARAIFPSHGLPCDPIDLFGIGYLDDGVGNSVEGGLFEGEALTGYTIPIRSGTGLFVGVDILTASGARVDNYTPPDGFTVPRGHYDPFATVLDVGRLDVVHYTLFVPGAQLAARSLAIRSDAAVIGINGSETIYIDICEASALRPVLVDNWVYAMDGRNEPDPGVSAIRGVIADMGFPPPPAVPWQLIFGSKSQIAMLSDIYGPDIAAKMRRALVDRDRRKNDPDIDGGGE